MTFHVRLIRDIPIRKGPLLAHSSPRDSGVKSWRIGGRIFSFIHAEIR